MRFSIQYRSLLQNILLTNVAIACIFQIPFAKHGPVSNNDLLRFLLIINFFFLLALIVQPPPRFIEVNKAAGTVTYGLLFRSRQVVLDSSLVWSEFTTRGSRFGPEKVWSLSLDGKELFFIPFDYTGWDESKLIQVNNLIADPT